jgi:hypothetical protein
MKKIALISSFLIWGALQAQAQTTPSPNTHAPEQSSQTFPQGDPTARTDSVKSKLVKGTQSERNARRSSNQAANTQKTRVKKTVKSTKDSGS